MDNFLWWIGLVTLVVLGIPTASFLLDWTITYFVRVIWTQKEFLAFVADRLRRRRD